MNMDAVNEVLSVDNTGKHDIDTYDEVCRLDTEDKKCRERKAHVLKSTAIMNITSHVLMLLFTIYLVVLSFKSYSLFSWHPALMTLGFVLLMGEAVMAMSSDNLLTTRLSRRGRVRAHWVLQASAAACIFAGHLIIVINKNLAGKLHFQTLHGILGLISVIFVAVTSLGGVVTLYTVSLKTIIKPAKLKLGHNIFGILTFAMGIISVVLGIYSKWFTKNSTAATQVIAAVVVVSAAVLAVQSAIKSAYFRLRAIMQAS